MKSGKTALIVNMRGTPIIVPINVITPRSMAEMGRIVMKYVALATPGNIAMKRRFPAMWPAIVDEKLA